MKNEKKFLVFWCENHNCTVNFVNYFAIYFMNPEVSCTSLIFGCLETTVKHITYFVCIVPSILLRHLLYSHLT